MKSKLTVLSLIAACILTARSLATLAQEKVPSQVHFSGFVDGQREQGLQSLSFALYKDQHEGAPLWQETQNVMVEADGKFGVLMG
jgi:hypothetical protein